MRHSILIICLLVALVSASCVKELPFPEEYNERFVVMNSYMSPDSTLKVSIEHSFLSTESIVFEDRKPIEGLEVNLFEDGNLIGNFNYNQSVYKLNYSPLLNHKYKISTNVNGDLISGHTEIPERIAITDLNHVISDVPDENSKSLDASIVFNDTKGQANYYLVHFNVLLYANGRVSRSLYYSCYNPILGIDMLSSVEESKKLLVFSDETIDGEIYEFSIHTSFQNSDLNSDSLCIYAELTSLSKDLYLFLKTKNRQNELIGNPFAEAQPIYSNIENGVGIVGSFQKSIWFKTIPFDELMN